MQRNRSRQAAWRFLLGLAALAPSGAGQGFDAALDLSKYDLRPVYENDFSHPQKIAREEDYIERTPDGAWRRKAKPDPDAEWIAEGWGGVEIRDGKLRVAPSPFDAAGRPLPADRRSHMVVWNRRIFPADFLLEYGMSPDASTSGLAIVFFCAAGQDGEDIFALSLPPRRADYPSYHSGAIANYSDSYWSRNTEEESASNRLRKNPGFQLVAQGPSLTTGPTAVTHHIRILKSGAHIEVEMNGHAIFQWDDPARPLGAGRVGLRSMEGVATIGYSGFKVWEIVRRGR